MFDHFSPNAAKLLLEALNTDELAFVDLGSDSMAPLLRRGDQVQLGPIALEELEIGDIVVVGTADDLLAHRYWGTQLVDGNTYLLVRGDRLPYYDAPIPETMLRAIVLGRRRSGHLLALRNGRGAWLNRKLTSIAQLDAQLMRLTIPSRPSSPDPVVASGLARRLARRLLYMSASVLTLSVSQLPG